MFWERWNTTKKEKREKVKSDRINVSSGSNGIKSIVMNLTVNNAFSVW
jgi:hypothetical protein